MSLTLRSSAGLSLVLPCIGALLGACRPTGTLVPDNVQAPLASLAANPNAAGALVYRGVVRPLDTAPEHRPAATYERRVRDDGELRVSSHITYAPDGRVILLHQAVHTHDYTLVAFRNLDGQRLRHATLRVDGNDLTLTRSHRRRARTRTEHVALPVVVGPTLFGWTLARWDALVRGEPQDLRFAVAEDGRSYAFELRLAHRDASTTEFTLQAHNALLRTIVRPMRLVFDTNTRKIIRYEGRVPPRRKAGRRLRAFDARVDYAFAAQQYR